MANEHGPQPPYGDQPPGAWPPPGGGTPPPYGQPPAWGEPTPPPLPEERNGPAWEWRAKLGFFRALGLTLKEVLLKPMETFALARREGGLGSPLLYFLIMTVSMNILNIILTWPLTSRNQRLMIEQMQNSPNAEMFERFGGAFSQAVSLPGQILFQLVIGPIGLTIWVFVAAGLMHLLLMLLGGARYGFEATFRVMAYVGGSVAALLLIPFCGAVIQVIAWPVLVILGLTKIHETDAWRAVLAVLIPAALVIFCLGAVFFAFMGMMAGRGM